MTRDIIDFTPSRQDPYAPNPEVIQAEIAQALLYTSPCSPQLQPRRDGNGRWIALAVIIGAVVAMAFVNFFMR
jgi:hypothetical protein